MKNRANDRDSFVSLLRASGAGEPVLYDDSEGRRIRDAWRGHYGRELERRFGRAAHGGYEWHAFSYDTYPCLSGEVALAAYGSMRGPVVVMTAWVRAPFVAARCPMPPAFDVGGGRRTMPPDLLVFPEDLAWTFAMTHEAGFIGPYFAMR